MPVGRLCLDDETLARSGKALVVGISPYGGSLLNAGTAMERARNVGHITALIGWRAPATIDRAADYGPYRSLRQLFAGAKKQKAITARFSI